MISATFFGTLNELCSNRLTLSSPGEARSRQILSICLGMALGRADSSSSARQKRGADHHASCERELPSGRSDGATLSGLGIDSHSGLNPTARCLVGNRMCLLRDLPSRRGGESLRRLAASPPDSLGASREQVGRLLEVFFGSDADRAPDHGIYLVRSHYGRTPARMRRFHGSGFCTTSGSATVS